MKKILLLGSRGKMGTAIKSVFDGAYNVVCKNSKDFDAGNFKQVRHLVYENSPDIVVNTVAFLGVDLCEKETEKAMLLNTLYPRFLAELSNELGFLLIHFSTDAVFSDTKRDYYVESDSRRPINMYGFTKYGGDCFIRGIAENYYIFRISILFGETDKATQFVEKMLKRVREGHSVLRIADDIISSPSYTKDIAIEIKRILETSLSFGTYHVSNEGKASLHDLMGEIIKCLKLDIAIEKASYKDFPSYGMKNTFTPIRSEKIKSLRPWQDAVKEYCLSLKDITRLQDATV